MSEAPRAGVAGLGVAATALEKAVALGVALYLPRHHLGLEDYGRYTYVLSHLNLFQALPDAALETALVARLANQSTAVRAIVGQGATLRFLCSVATGGLGLAGLRLVSDDPVVQQAGLAWSMGLVATAANPFRPLLRAELRMGRYLALIGGQVTVALLCFGAALAGGGGVPEIMLAIGAGNLFGIGFGWWLARGGIRPGWSRSVAQSLWSVAAPLAATALVLLGAQQWLQIALLRQHGIAAAGLVGGAQKLLDGVNVLSQAVMITLLPALAMASRQSRAGAVAIAGRVTARLVLVLAPIAVALWCWPAPAIGALFGDRLLPAAEILRLASVTVVLHATGAVLTNLLVPLGQQRVLFGATAASAVVTVAVGAWLVPAAAGVGVAIALVAGMGAGQLLLWLVPETRAATAAVWRGACPALVLAALVAAIAVAADGGPLVFLGLYLPLAGLWAARKAR